MASIRLPEGWSLELFASEPDVANIVAFDVDAHGRVFVCETFRQSRGVTDNRAHDQNWLLADLAAQTVQDRIDYHKRLLGDAAITYAQHDDRIRRLRDTTGDGRADESIVFASGFNRLEEGTGAGVLARGNDVYFTCIPKLWKLVDANGDGKADERVVLSDGYGVRVAFRGHDLHGLIMGPDGRLYFSIGDRGYNVTTKSGRVLNDASSGAVFRCEPDGSSLEVVATGLRNPQELAFNDFGDLFTGDNNSDSGDRARLVQIVEGGDSGWRMHYQYLTDRGPFNREKIWHPLHEEQPAYIVPPIANFADGPSGFAFDPGTGVDDSVRGQFLLCDFRGGPTNSGIRSFRLEHDGAFYRLAESAEPIWGVLATDLMFGPDGALWVSDWVNGWEGLGKGRLYRLTGPDFDSDSARQVAAILASDWASLPVQTLMEQLRHRDRRVRNESQWELARRGDVDSLIAVANDLALNSFARQHAIWGLGQILRRTNEASGIASGTIHAALAPCLRDDHEAVRAAAAQTLAYGSVAGTVSTLLPLLEDPAPRVRLHASLTTARLLRGGARDANAFPAAVAMLERNDNRDPMIRHAGVMILSSTGDVKAVASLRKHTNLSVRRAAVVALRRMASESIAEFLDDPSPLVIQEAARAIHDLPLPVSTTALAKRITQPIEDDAVMRRVLNANFRLGGPQQAAELAAFAARPVASVPLRLEAVGMLESWAANEPLDRVLGDYRPVGQRPSSVAAVALSKVLPEMLRNADDVREAAVSLAAELGLTEVAPFLQQRVTDKNLRPEGRASALGSLARIMPAAAQPIAVELISASQPRLRIAALEVLSELDPAAAVLPLQIATNSQSMAERQVAWDRLAKIDSQAARDAIVGGLKDFLAGDKIAADTTLNLLEAAGDWVDPGLSEALAAHQAEREKADPLAKWSSSLEGGDAARGAEIFQKTQLSCVRCHRVGRTGGEVGPVLTTIGAQRDRRYLLESICLPDAAIAQGYETAVIADDAGQIFTGIIKSENETTIELIAADGSRIRIEKETVVARRRGKSAMPEELVTYMTPRELRDLVAYLASLKVDPRGSDSKDASEGASPL